MKNAFEIAAVLTTLHWYLPKRIRPERVTLDAERAEKGMFRVLLDGNLVSEWGHGVCGWMPVESGLYHGRDGASVYRAAQRAMKAHF